MNTQHLNNRRAVERRKSLLADTTAYVESIGKTDIETLGAASAITTGKGTVMRLILGASEEMPARAITYIDSALRIAMHVPCEQIQIIHANQLGASVNGVNHARACEQAHALARHVRTHIQRCHPHLRPRVLHANDSSVDLSPFSEIAHAALATIPAVYEKLKGKGLEHGGNFARYASAHFVYQDTDLLDLVTLDKEAPVQVRAERIISVGCQQERTFYAVRMAMREIAMNKIPMIDSSQIFTKHLTPPYYVARGGEPLLKDVDFHTLELDTVGDMGARRDLSHFLRLNFAGLQNA